MSKISPIIIFIIIFTSGLIGGGISNSLFHNAASANSNEQNIIARSITLVDAQGNPRAGIDFEDGNPVFYLRDSAGKTRAYIALTAEGPQLVFRDPKENMQLYIESSRNGSSSIGLMAGGKQQRLTLSYFPGQGPTIGLFDENNIGKTIISVTDGNPSVALLDHDNKPAIAMISKKGKGSLLGVWNSQNEPRISMGLLNDKPIFFMYEQYQTGLLFNMQSGGRPALALMDNGSPIWSATGAVPSAPELPPMDDMLREITR